MGSARIPSLSRDSFVDLVTQALEAGFGTEACQLQVEQEKIEALGFLVLCIEFGREAGNTIRHSDERKVNWVMGVSPVTGCDDDRRLSPTRGTKCGPRSRSQTKP